MRWNGPLGKSHILDELRLVGAHIKLLEKIGKIGERRLFARADSTKDLVLSRLEAIDARLADIASRLDALEGGARRRRRKPAPKRQSAS